MSYYSPPSLGYYIGLTVSDIILSTAAATSAPPSYLSILFGRFHCLGGISLYIYSIGGFTAYVFTLSTFENISFNKCSFYHSRIFLLSVVNLSILEYEVLTVKSCVNREWLELVPLRADGSSRTPRPSLPGQNSPLNSSGPA